MAGGATGAVRLLQADPELGRGVDPATLGEATERLVVRAAVVPRGSWCPRETTGPGRAAIGLLVLDGLLVREANVGGQPSAELLGPADLLGAPDDDPEALLPRTVHWTALTRARVAVIDRGLAARAAPYPQVLTALMERAAGRAERLVVMHAIGHLHRVDDRLLALLWCLAERWGRVGPDGVVLSLRLHHRTLAGMIGARRPSVTTALGQLLARGDVERRPDGGLVLRGEPPVVAAARAAAAAAAA